MGQGRGGGGGGVNEVFSYQVSAERLLANDSIDNVNCTRSCQEEKKMLHMFAVTLSCQRLPAFCH